MKKDWIVTAVLGASLVFAGCAASAPATVPAPETTAAATTAAPETTAAETTAAPEIEAPKETKAPDPNAMRIGSLKGPTSMGLVNLMQLSEDGESDGSYAFTMAAQADEIMGKLVSGDLDVALIPANAASILYSKTEGGISVVDINTLGVLYCVTGDENVKSIEDLSGKKVVTTGQGTTPEYALRYLLDAYNIDDCKLEFKSEATEVAALLEADPNTISVLPQPFATATCMKNNELKTAFSLTEAWDAVTADSRMVTGVTVVRNDYLAEHEEEVKTFIDEHGVSAADAVEDVEGTAVLVEKYGIIANAKAAEKALPQCSIVCLTGSEMKQALSGYLAVLADQDEKSIGGSLPEDDFYYLYEDEEEEK